MSLSFPTRLSLASVEEGPSGLLSKVAAAGVCGLVGRLIAMPSAHTALSVLSALGNSVLSSLIGDG